MEVRACAWCHLLPLPFAAAPVRCARRPELGRPPSKGGGVEVRACTTVPLLRPPSSPLVCAQQQGVRPPLHTQGVDIASALHHASPPIYIYIIHPSAYQKCLPNILMKRLRAEQNSVEFCFFVFCVFWKSSIFHTFFLSKHKQKRAF